MFSHSLRKNFIFMLFSNLAFIPGLDIFRHGLFFSQKVSGNSVHTRSRAFATFSTIEKALAGHKKSFRGPYVV